MQRDNIDDEKKEIGSDVKIRADLFGLIGVLPFCMCENSNTTPLLF